MNITKNAKNILYNIKNNLPTLRRNNARYNHKLANRYTPTITYQDLEIYYKAMENPWVSRCLEVYKDTALGCGFSIDTDTIDTDDTESVNYLTNLFERPLGTNNYTTWANLNSRLWEYMVLGDVFFEISTDSNFNVLNGFQYIHNDQIMWQEENDCYALREQPTVQYEPDELIHIFTPHPRREHERHGKSLIDNIALLLAIMQNGLKYNNDLLDNKGLDPNAFLSFDKDIDDYNFNSEIERLNLMKEQSTGGLMAVRGATYQTGANTNKDMSYLQLLTFVRDTVIAQFGVPPQKVGIIETANLGSGSGDSQNKDWKMTFEGRSVFIEDAFNTVLKSYGFSERFTFNKIDVVDEMYEAQVNQIYLQNGVKTVDEVRNELGYDKLQIDSWGTYYR